MKTQRLREKIGEFLLEAYISDFLSQDLIYHDLGVRNTEQIKTYINNNMRHGTTSQQLGNVLSKNKKKITKASDSISRQGILSGSYDICGWNINLEGYASIYPDKFEKHLKLNELNREDILISETNLESMLV